jgi:hypothetical protein
LDAHVQAYRRCTTWINSMLYVAAALVVGLGIAHSVLGERYIIARLLRRDLPQLFGGDQFTKQTLRFAWHITTIVWFALAAILAAAASAPSSPFRSATLAIVAIGAVVSSLFPLYFTRGRHLSWIVLLAIGLLVWLARN